MPPTAELRFRRRVATDMPDAYRVYRLSLFDYLHRTGQIDTETAANPAIEGSWLKWRPWIEHLAATAAEDWVAEDPDGRIVGWAQSVEREGMLELTLFFVDPTAQSRGIGRGLLERAFPLGRGHTRTIIATQDPRGLGLYLRFGVAFASTSVEFVGRPSRSEIATDLAIARVEAGHEPAAEGAIVDIERELLGHGRTEDTRFLLADRPVWLARRGGRVVGMAFGVSSLVSGPIGAGPVGALDPSDLPALMATIENEAAARGVEQLAFTIPLVNSIAVGHILERGFQIDPFYVVILSSDTRMRLDRWVHTGSEFIV